MGSEMCIRDRMMSRSNDFLHIDTPEPSIDVLLHKAIMDERRKKKDQSREMNKENIGRAIIRFSKKMTKIGFSSRQPSRREEWYLL